MFQVKCEILDDINRSLKEVTSRLDEMNYRFTSQIDDVINRIDRIEEIQKHIIIGNSNFSHMCCLRSIVVELSPLVHKVVGSNLLQVQGKTSFYSY